jgi:uncharacterized protein (TIGR02246 family)
VALQVGDISARDFHRVQRLQAEQAEERTIAQVLQAWSNGDAAAFSSLFTLDADFVAFSGVHLAGREAIEAAHRTLFAGPMRAH